MPQIFKKGKITRKDVWITAKLWIKDAAPKHVAAALDESLRKMKVLIQHWLSTATYYRTRDSD